MENYLHTFQTAVLPLDLLLGRIFFNLNPQLCKGESSRL